MPDRNAKKYVAFRKEDKGGRGNGLVGKSTGTFSGSAAPRVGGVVKPTGMASGTASKKLIKKSMANVKANAASKQAKRSARKLY